MRTMVIVGPDCAVTFTAKLKLLLGDVRGRALLAEVGDGDSLGRVGRFGRWRIVGPGREEVAAAPDEGDRRGGCEHGAAMPGVQARQTLARGPGEERRGRFDGVPRACALARLDRTDAAQLQGPPVGSPSRYRSVQRSRASRSISSRAACSPARFFSARAASTMSIRISYCPLDRPIDW